MAVEERRWNRVGLLIVFPFSAWFFPSRVVARPAHPRPAARAGPREGHCAPKVKPERESAPEPPPKLTPAPKPDDSPPPGTPKEFLGMPVIPPKPKRPTSIDPDKVEQLRKKMRDEGML